MPKVIAGCPSRNRAHMFEPWFKALEAQTRRPDRYLVLLNDCEDDSVDKCPVEHQTLNTGDPGWQRIGQRYSVTNLARLRNEWVKRCLNRDPDVTHLWSVDSDILPAPNVLERLLAADKPIIAALVPNHADGCVFNYFTGRDLEGPRRQGMDAIIWSFADRPFEVTMTGACVLIRRDVVDAGVRYGDHSRGEDVAWSMSAAEHGFPLYLDPRSYTGHLQETGEIWK